MASRDWAWGVVPLGFKSVTDGREGLMIVRDDVEKFLSFEECTKASGSHDHKAGSFRGRGSLRALELPNGDAVLIRPYRHGGLFRHLLPHIRN